MASPNKHLNRCMRVGVALSQARNSRNCGMMIKASSINYAGRAAEACRKCLRMIYSRAPTLSGRQMAVWGRHTSISPPGLFNQINFARLHFHRHCHQPSLSLSTNNETATRTIAITICNSYLYEVVVCCLSHKLSMYIEQLTTTRTCSL
jgi:hypothetical protein